MNSADDLGKRPGNHATEGSHGSQTPAPDPAEEGREPGGGLAEILTRFVQTLAASADSLIEVRSDRLMLSVRRKVVQVAIGAALTLCAALWMGAAALTTLRGLCGGLTDLWSGRAWLGDLTGGLLALALAAGAIALFLRLGSRRELERLKAKYERIREQHTHAASNGRTTPRPGGGLGAAADHESAGQRG